MDMFPQLEGDVLRVIWELGNASVRDVWRAMRSLGKRRAYTTIMTTMVRLCQKGFLKRKKIGRRYIYEPTLSRSETAKLFIKAFLERMFIWFGEPASAYLIEVLNERPSKTRTLSNKPNSEPKGKTRGQRNIDGGRPC
ncbi:MAG: BlaI/MecI/CopY family transcriptional regulator [Armatimonadota bacterium]|nr:BlaI/MecI/CopY family transcriptional regulator [Armatimonadota bacterium]MCX7778148.1 BlaI/MecI/CopY family transcriptional regulator [Armatimonadota bacterium]MDW8024502.1 BlaI/MecI/CopY family transcriptional regulator [Armatimonadota bacterium]